MSDTPRTQAIREDLIGIASEAQIWKLFKKLEDMERELNKACDEIERLDTAGIHSCHKDCQRPNCVLRRELRAVTEQRDELLRYNEAFRKETLICADCDAIRKEEYDMAIEQRDRLMEAIRKHEETLPFSPALAAVEGQNQ